jgi:hypothetical protein
VRQYNRLIKQPGLPKPVRDYLACLLNPFACSSQIPDNFSKETVIVPGITSLNIPVKFFATPNVDDGRFSFAVKPIIGELSSPNRYQVAAVDCTKLTTWDTSVDWSQSNLYITNNNGLDPRLDVNAKFLAGTIASFWRATTATGTPSKPLDTPVTDASFSTTNFVFGSDANFAWIYFPQGSYQVTITTEFTGTGAGVIQYATNAVVAGNPSPTSVPLQIVTRPAASVVAAQAGSVTWDGIVKSGGAAGIFAPCIVNNGTTTPATNITITNTTIMISPTNTVNSTYSGTGVIESIRPVGMACLVSYTGPTLIDGGQLSIGQYDGTTWTAISSPRVNLVKPKDMKPLTHSARRMLPHISRMGLTSGGTRVKLGTQISGKFLR